MIRCIGRAYGRGANQRHPTPEGLERGQPGSFRGTYAEGVPGIVAVDEALDALAQIDPRKAKVIELRFFGGLSVEETAEVLKISPQSVMRDWKMARAWLLGELAR